MTKQHWSVRILQREINRSPYTVPCLLFRERVLVTDHGPMSHENDRELLALLDGGIGSTGGTGNHFWYGHVLKWPMEKPGSAPVWVALIIYSEYFVDAPTVDLVFQRFRYAMRVRAEYTPAVIQDHEDAFAIRATFDDACLALAEMIRRFDPRMREVAEIFDPPDYYGQDDLAIDYHSPGRDDLRCIDIYGLNCCQDQNGAFPPKPKYEFPATETQAEMADNGDQT